MKKRIHLIIILSILLGFTLSGNTQNKKEPAVASSSNYNNLASLFQEFREFQKPELINGVPDYSQAAMEKKSLGLKHFRQRLEVIDPNNWPVAQKVDYVLVWAEMNGMEFYLRVLKPWWRDPVFYLPSQGGAGPVIDINLRIGRQLPLPEDKIDEVRKQLKVIPEIYKQAEQNLTEAAGDLALIALHYIDYEAGRYQRLANRLAEYHPDLVPYVEKARDAVKNYGQWLEENKHKMTAPAGIGIDNYNWWLQKVHLFPYTWKKCLCIPIPGRSVSAFQPTSITALLPF